LRSVSNKQTCSATKSITWLPDKSLPAFLTTYAIGTCPASSSGYLTIHHIYIQKHSKVLIIRKQNWFSL